MGIITRRRTGQTQHNAQGRLTKQIENPTEEEAHSSATRRLRYEYAASTVAASESRKTQAANVASDRRS